MFYKNTISAKIKLILMELIVLLGMEKNKLNQSAIAEQLGITQAAVSKWFRLDSKPTISNAIKLEKLFNIPVEIWVDEETTKKFIENNSAKFGAIKILRKEDNDSA